MNEILRDALSLQKLAKDGKGVPIGDDCVCREVLLPSYVLDETSFLSLKIMHDISGLGLKDEINAADFHLLNPLTSLPVAVFHNHI